MKLPTTIRKNRNIVSSGEKPSNDPTVIPVSSKNVRKINGKSTISKKNGNSKGEKNSLGLTFSFFLQYRLSSINDYIISY